MMEEADLNLYLERIRRNIPIIESELGDETAYLLKCARLFVKVGRNAPDQLPKNSINTLIHGDLHRGNVFFDDKDNPILLDWQLVQRGNPGTDMASWIGSFEIANTAKEGRQLMKIYHKALRAHGVAGYGLRKLKTEYLQWIAAGAMFQLAMDTNFERETNGQLKYLDEFIKSDTMLRRHHLIYLFRVIPLVYWFIRFQVRIQNYTRRFQG